MSPNTVEANSMDEIYDALAERLLRTAAVGTSNPNLKLIVSLAGPPGSGKSTIASEVVRRVNKLWPQKASSFDSQVNKAPDVKCLKKLTNEELVCATSFDHGVGDPVEDDIFVSLEHKVVMVEGNYLLLDEEIWKDMSSMFDVKWFVDVDIDTAMQRVLKTYFSSRNASRCW